MVNAAMRWVLTRTKDEGGALAQRLGCTLEPCVERIELAWPEWPSWPLASLVFITSKTAAERLAREWEKRPVGTTVAAVAPSTNAVLVSHGIRAVVTAEGGSVALAQAVKAAGVKPVSILYPTSDAGERQPEQATAIALLQQLAPVHRRLIYSVRAPEGLDQRLAALGPSGFIFYSPSAVEHVAEASVVPLATLCIGASTLRAADAQQGWPTGREVREEELPSLIKRPS
jgi:uroporphyrinogen-III synthase